ncbi:MAG: ABC transporter ATP-binding protein, partial [Planctomycetes bacterium]|nr:ABC transporter ATP-binding protein [Planctomycetota bacterium]
EIAKGLLHNPRVLLLDEPSTGLDPGARLDLWRYLQILRDEAGVTILVTTHLMDEAERCDRLGILDKGRLIALGRPEELRQSIGGDCLTIQTTDPTELARLIQARFQISPTLVGSQLRLETPDGCALLSQIVSEFREHVSSIALGQPTLEDVFVQRTGHRFWDEKSVP